MDYYRVLGVRRDASAQDIKSAFRQMALQWHPDRHLGKDEKFREKVGARFRELAEAYEVLGDEHRRALYNRDGRGSASWQNPKKTTNYRTYDPPFRARGGQNRAEGGSGRTYGYGNTNYGQSRVVTFGGTAADYCWRGTNEGKSFEEVIESLKRHRETLEKEKIRKDNRFRKDEEMER